MAQGIKNSEQTVLNTSFDETYNVLAVEPMGYDGQNLVRPQADDLQIFSTTSGGYTYFCFAAVGTPQASALWKIFRLDANCNKMYADGNANYDNIASDPTLLSYSYS